MTPMAAFESIRETSVAKLGIALPTSFIDQKQNGDRVSSQDDCDEPPDTLWRDLFRC